MLVLAIIMLECRQDRSAERVQGFGTLHEDRVPGSWLGHSVSPWGRKREGAQTEERWQQPQQVSDRDRLFGKRRKRGRLACLRGGLAQAAASWWEAGGEWIGYRRRWRASALLCATALWMTDSSFLAADRFFPSADSCLCQFGALTCLFANPPHNVAGGPADNDKAEWIQLFYYQTRQLLEADWFHIFSPTSPRLFGIAKLHVAIARSERVESARDCFLGGERGDRWEICQGLRVSSRTETESTGSLVPGWRPPYCR